MIENVYRTDATFLSKGKQFWLSSSTHHVREFKIIIFFIDFAAAQS